MPPLLPDEATKAQETFRLGDRFYVEEHGLVLGGLLPSGTMNIYKGKFELSTGESTDLQIYVPSILILFSPLNHNPSISIIPAQWNNTISALFEGIINLNSNIEGRICLLKKGKTVTIINNSQGSKFSYLQISVDDV